MRKSAASVIESRQARTLRLSQTMTAARQTKPPAIGTQVMSIAQTWFGRVTARFRGR